MMNHQHSIRGILGGFMAAAAAFALFSSATAEDGFCQDGGQVAADESLDLSGVEVDEFDTFNIHSLKLIPQYSQCRKILPRIFSLRILRRNGHQSLNLNPLQLPKR